VQSRSRALLSLIVGGCLFAVACGGSDPDTASVGDSAARSGELTVFAASSLQAAFTEIGEAFGAEYPDVQLTFSFAASSELVAQIGEGAPADVFASADQSNMSKLIDAGLNVSDAVVFTNNSAAILVGPGNPAGITEVADLARPELVVVQCAPEVPCGKYAAAVFAKAGIEVTPKSLEQNVKAVVSKVTLGEADAGIVYVTDVIAAGDAAAGVTIPTELNVTAEYPLAVTRNAANPELAAVFVAFVVGPEAQRILSSYGFVAP
jgi:molybdate transport system substrate-binding protein